MSDDIDPNPSVRARLLEAARSCFLNDEFHHMQMFMATRGRERTLSGWRAPAESAGCALEAVIGLRPVGSILLLTAGG